MKHSWCRRAAFLMAVAALPGQALADVLVVSQNSLHLGQGSSAVTGYVAGKNAFIQALSRWPGSSLPQLTFLQEVMAQASEQAIAPAGGIVHFGVLKGTTSYLERYGVVLVNDAGNHLAILCHVDTGTLVTTGVTVQRPPDATLIADSSSGSPKYAWFLNFHATFGTGTAVRRAEVAELGNIIARLRGGAPAGCPRTSDNAVVLGDWNLSAADPSFQTLAANAGFGRLGFNPNVPTSLNPQGRRVSPYDHFIWDDTRVQVTLATLPAQPMCSTTASFVAGVLTPSTLLSFRQRCSDHLGVGAMIRIR